MNFTAEQIQANWNELTGYIDTYITGDRKEKLKAFYQKFEERLIMMPAAAIDHHHSAFVGGYVDHVNRVIRCTFKVRDLWAEEGATINYTDEELVFSAMNHDLGKMGSEDQPYYIPNQSEWHRKNQGKIYEYNTLCTKMPVPQRSLFLMQSHGIEVTETEYIAIMTHDGLYDEANKAYLMTWSPGQKPKANLTYVLHQADMMAARIEFEIWAKDEPKLNGSSESVSKPVVSKLSKAGKAQQLSGKKISKTGKALFHDLFENKDDK